MADKISMDKTYRTRDGQKVELTIINDGHTSAKYPIAGDILKNNARYSRKWTANGFYNPNEVRHPLDLIEVKGAPEAKVGASLLKSAELLKPSNLIEMDKTYQTQSGREVVIDKISNRDVGYPVSGRMFATDSWVEIHWTRDGRWSIGENNPLDLIEVPAPSDAPEMDAEVSAPSVEMGKTYRTRDGRDVTIDLISNEDIGYPVSGRVEDTWGTIRWTRDGRWVHGSDNFLDLIEVPEFDLRGPIQYVETDEAPAPSDVDTTLDQREMTHGDYATRARVVQGIKELMRSGSSWDEVSPAQRQSLDMFADKMSRIVCGDPNEPDHWHDIEGYARLVSKELAALARVEVPHTPMRVDVLTGEKKLVHEDIVRMK